MHGPKTLPLLTYALSLFLSANFFECPEVRADDGSGLGSTNFGHILPQAGLGGGGPFSAPSFGDNLPSSFNRDAVDASDFPGINPQEPGPAAPTTIGLDRPNAWYKFLEPSLNLTRALEESERKHLLSIVPVPLNLRAQDPRKSDTRIVLLRADSSSNYACFKTVFGGVYARNDALLLVHSGKVVRVANISGKEKDLVFKLPNGQMIVIGPGSEMVVSRSLSTQDINPPDTVARRGMTRVMKCSDLQMAFSQFSYKTMLELPELKYFCKQQSPKYLEGLNAIVSAIDGIRGLTGFRTAVQPGELVAKAKNPVSKPLELGSKVISKTDAAKSGLSQKTEAERKQQELAKQKEEAGRKQRQLAKQKEEAEGKQRQLAEQKVEVERKQRQLAEQKAAVERKQKQLAEQKAAVERKQKQLAEKKLEAERRHKQLAEQKSRSEQIAAQEQSGARSAAINDKKKKQESAEKTQADKAKVATKADAEESKLASEKTAGTKIKSRLSLGEKVKNSFSYNVFDPPAKSSSTVSGTGKLLPRKMPGTNTPPDIARLLLESNEEEKLSISLRKKADKCLAFIAGGLMGPEQQKRMMLEAKNHLRDAAAAEERCQSLRRQAELAESGQSSL